ncbi:phosphoethanolamine transferase domain-containing protein, partial [Rodentibacter caecimuris]|uniref:phosphoethanolamine transferase domain-containing protein n=1 Tax=Rodentibacter caecimuris TaxID=1796644 RepID=UPI00117AEBBD
MKKNSFSLSSARLISLLSLYFTLVLNYAFYLKVIEINPLSGSQDDWFIYTIPVVIFCLLNAAFQIIALPFLHKVFIPVLLIISSGVSYYSIFFNIYFDSSMLTNILQTTITESSKLITPSYILWV